VLEQPIAALVAGLLLAPLSCGDSEPPSTASPEPSPRVESRHDPRPNILWVVWDTVRADHLSLYGYAKLTTPHLQEWAQGSRVFANAVSTASSTVPSHASMFTGLLPSEHGANNDHRFLDDEFTTVAELLRESGYQTYLFAANPHISEEENFTQGFEVHEHPWSEKYSEEAKRIVLEKLRPDDRSSGLVAQAEAGQLGTWGIKASGALAQRGLESWLAVRDRERPWFAFLNYMEAHRPFIPAARYRARMMDPDQVERSFQVDRSWYPMWAYVFGLGDYDEGELATMAATYDATLAELDDLFHDLVRSLEASGELENTIVILVSDHGEHLGEHRMLDHQYSLYQDLLRVPLVIWAPGRIEPGWEEGPVMTFDLFPTLLEFAGIQLPARPRWQALSLQAPDSRRWRLAEYPAPMGMPLQTIERAHPGFDTSPWRRSLQALMIDGLKYIRGSDGRSELYDLARDPGETRDLAADRATDAEQMQQKLNDLLGRIDLRGREGNETPEISDEQRRRLEALGYLDPAETPAPSPPSDPPGP
jgi:arylsulfatase A-like enzyme